MWNRVKNLLYFGVFLWTSAYLQPFRICVVEGPSMEPNYHTNQKCVYMTLLPFSQPKDGDVVVFRHDGEILVKRVKSVAGERCQLMLTDVFGHETIVRKGYLYVIGDNLPDSYDSRYFGPIPISSVLGVIR